jgi:CheY-like chemotaxis protein
MGNSPLRVLIADDEEVIRLFLARVLEDMGCVCEFAIDGKDCLDRFHDGRTYDVLLLDLVMPRMDGEAVLKEVTREHPETSVVMLSVQDDEEAIRELLDQGASVYVTKPISAPALKEVIQRIQEERAQAVEH